MTVAVTDNSSIKINLYLDNHNVQGAFIFTCSAMIFLVVNKHCQSLLWFSVILVALATLIIADIDF